jgi:sugar phosphate isomerase/epimerase
VKANLDISHLVLARQPAALLERLRGRVAHVHISDCDGKVHGDLPPGRGVVDFPPYLEKIKDLGLDDATISIELEYAPEPDKIEGWVREAYEATARLMRAAGLRP